MPAKPAVVAFDIIETVFSLESMRARLVSLGLPPNALETWFASGLRDAFALAATDRFAPFRSVLEAALANILSQHGLPFDKAEAASVLDGMAKLEPHPDAAEAFAALRQGGLRIAALSNGAGSATKALLKGAGLDSFVDQVFSVDEVKLSKPRREVYLHAAKLSGASPGQVALAATHAWDVHGAKAAGLIGAFVARGQSYPAAMVPPDVTGETLIDVARALLRPG
jgi:2-haloacid dehalogenase